MKRYLILLFLFTLMVAPGALQAQTPSGMSVTCDNGSSFDNGVEVIVTQMRSGFNYTATAVGLNGFDPVLAVLDTSTGNGLCSDDEASASRYGANLPTTGRVNPSNLSAQVTFSQNSSSTFADVSLVVGGYGNQSGEFLLIREGMGVTAADGAGDAFSVNLTPGMVASGVPLSVYMITRGTSGVDPLIYQSDSNLNPITDTNGNYISCDDAGDSSNCWGSSTNLSNSSITIGSGTLPGWQYDAMLTESLSNLSLSSDRTQNYYTFVMTSYQQSTQGQYLLVFHIGESDTVSTNGGSSSGGLTGGSEETSSGNNQTAPTPIPPNNNSSAGLSSGMSVTCDNGSSFDNGVEVIVTQMRSGFNYTATAVGLNGFDPVLAVLDTSTGNGLCSDDEASASRYAANLPTSGQVNPSNLSAQVTFSQNSSSTFADVSLVVGGYGNQSGEFLLILEGMGVTAADGAGDAFSVNLTPGMVASGVPLSVYMITRGTSGVDPLIYQSDSSLNALTDSSNNYIACDDAGDSSTCWGTSTNLSNSSVTIGSGTLPGWNYDAMLTLPLSGLRLNSDRTQNYYTFVMTSYQQSTQGQYLLVFHIGEAASGKPNT